MRSKLSQKGMMALTVTMVVLIVVSIITIFVSRFVVTQNKVFNNDRNSVIALNAAQSGFDYALGYINSYSYIVLERLNYCSGGASSTYSLPVPSNHSLPSDATYSMTFSCIVQPPPPPSNYPVPLSNNYTFLQLTATATVPGSFATRTITAQLKQFCGGVISPVIARQNVTLAQSVITNSVSAPPLSIVAGGSVAFNGAASTTGFSGNAAYTCSAHGGSGFCHDVLQNTQDLNAMSDADFQRLYLGGLLGDFSRFAGIIYSPRATYTLDCRSGISNKVFDQNTTISSQGCTTWGNEPFGNNGNRFSGNNGTVMYISIGSRNLTLTSSGVGVFSMGTATLPDIIVVNSTGGTLTISSGGSGGTTIFGNIYTNAPTFNISNSGVTIHGMIFSLNQLNINSAVINGSVVANNVSLSSGAAVNYTANALDVIRGVKSGLCAGGYAVVPGSWRDF